MRKAVRIVCVPPFLVIETTSLNIGVNCAQKEMKVRYWEGEDIIYHAKL